MDAEIEKCLASLQRLAVRFGSRVAIENQSDPSSPRYAPLDGWSWTAPFYSGLLWTAFDRSGLAIFRERAESIEPQLAALVQTPRANHDVGFFGQLAYRNPQYVAEAVEVMVSRWVPERRAFRSWDWMESDNSIVDSLMTTNLLWGTRYEDKALFHYHRLSEDIVRPDGSTFHVLKYKGDHLRKGDTHQGLAANSTWARGQAWAVHGFTTAYLASNALWLLEAARRTADYAIAQMPATGDSVPRWDYDAGPDALPDSSAGAILADGLRLLGTVDGAYDTPAHRLLTDLTSGYSVAASPEHDGLLAHGHQGHNGPIFDGSMPYGDYYYLRALLNTPEAA